MFGKGRSKPNTECQHATPVNIYSKACGIFQSSKLSNLAQGATTLWNKVIDGGPCCSIPVEGQDKNYPRYYQLLARGDSAYSSKFLNAPCHSPLSSEWTLNAGRGHDACLLLPMPPERGFLQGRLGLPPPFPACLAIGIVAFALVLSLSFRSCAPMVGQWWPGGSDMLEMPSGRAAISKRWHLMIC